MRRGGDAGGAINVFVGDGDAIERAAQAAGGGARLGGLGGGQGGFGGDADEGVDLVVQRLGPGEGGFGEFDRRDFAGGDEAGGFGDAVHHFSPAAKVRAGSAAGGMPGPRIISSAGRSMA